MKWPLLPRSSLEQKHTTLSSRSEVVEWRGGWRRNEAVARALLGLRGVLHRNRFISYVTSVGWLVTRVRCGGAGGEERGVGGGV